MARERRPQRGGAELHADPESRLWRPLGPLVRAGQAQGVWTEGALLVRALLTRGSVLPRVL